MVCLRSQSEQEGLLALEVLVESWARLCGTVLPILPAPRRGRYVTDNPQWLQTQGWAGPVLCCIEPLAGHPGGSVLLKLCYGLAKSRFHVARQ